MLSDKWLALFFISLAVTALLNALYASSFKQFYRNLPIGRLSHSQLRIKQGNATIEHRINVFVQTLIFSCLSLRVYIATLILWALCNTVIYFSFVNS